MTDDEYQKKEEKKRKCELSNHPFLRMLVRRVRETWWDNLLVDECEK
jgi:hypothetical protein